MTSPESPHRSILTLDAGLDEVRRSPVDDGELMMIVVRPDEGERRELNEAQLDSEQGLVGDSWSRRASRLTDDGSPHPGMQLTLMNARAIQLVAGSTERWSLAGDQLYVDLDLSMVNLPPGTQLAVGEAVIELSPEPHTGCAKFSQRFGADARRWVNSDDGKRLRLRGVNGRVLRAGSIRTGDVVRKLA